MHAVCIRIQHACVCMHAAVRAQHTCTFPIFIRYIESGAVAKYLSEGGGRPTPANVKAWLIQQ